MPANIQVDGITQTSFTVRWTKGTVRPGITTYTVNVRTTMLNLDKTLSVEGNNDNLQ